MSNENSGNVLPSDYCCHLFAFAKLAKIYKFRFANSWFDSPMATWRTLTGTLVGRRAMVMKVQGRRKRGRPKRRWFDKVKEDIKDKGLSADDVYDRATWRRMSLYIDPT